MSSSRLLLRLSFATTILLSTIATYIASTPPNPPQAPTSTPLPPPTAKDSLTTLTLTSPLTGKLALLPLLLASLHTSLIALFPPHHIPPALIMHGHRNNYNHSLFRWSWATGLPLASILLVGVPLRLWAYASLGVDFTFVLTTPERLVTRGVYAWVQHPGYTALLVVVLANVALFGRGDGLLALWYRPVWYYGLRKAVRVGLVPVVVGGLATVVWVRVVEEEALLRDRFGADWVGWNKRVSRFVPGVF